MVSTELVMAMGHRAAVAAATAPPPRRASGAGGDHEGPDMNGTHERPPRDAVATSRVGQVFENPATGERAVILTDPRTDPDRRLVAHLYVRPGGRVALEHIHPTLTERFLVLRGHLAVALDGRTSTLGPGERAQVPAGVRHDWWHSGDEETQALVEVDPGDRFVEMLTSLWGRVRDSGARRGIPGPLQMAVSGAAYRDVMVAASPPRWVQEVLFATLGPIGRILGRRPSYTEYTQSATVVEPDPAALALLTPDGRIDWTGAAR